MHPLRTHKSYLAFIGHRLSGLALAIFLPFHFLLLGTAIEGAAALDNAIKLTDNTAVHIAEWGLIVLLVIHLGFGIRLLALEFTEWPTRQNNRAGWILPATAVSVLLGMLFLWIR